MTIYRATRRLNSASQGVIEAGQRTRLDWLSPGDVQRLLQRGLVRREESPQLRELAGWKTRGNRLAAHDVETIEDFLDADPAWLAEQMRVKPATVARWTEELESWFEAPLPKRG